MNNDIEQINYFELEGNIENLTIKVAVRLNQIANDHTPLVIDFYHTHCFYEIFVCTDGKLTINFDDKSITINKNDAIIIPPGISHTSKNEDLSSAKAIGFTCLKNSLKSTNDLYNKFLPLINTDNYIILENCPELCNTVSDIARFAESTTSYIFAIKFAVELLNCITALKNNTEHTKNKATVQAEILEIERMMELDDLIGKHTRYNLRIEDIAKSLNICRRHLDRISIKRYGKPIYALIIEKRITLAAKMLVETELRIEQIALSVGFNSTNSLYRAFEKKYNCTPNEFRKQKRS